MKMQNVEDAYPLSPMQQLMLLHTLSDTEDRLFEQFVFTLRGALNVSAFQRAWQTCLERHTILRTAFFWEGLKQPLQVVRQTIKLPWKYLDWREFSPDEQHNQLEHLLQEDRQQGFSLSQAPLLRLTLIQMTDETCCLLWSRHHLVLDGWSGSMLLREVFVIYEALNTNQEPQLAPARPYRDYISWLQQQNMHEAESYWRQALQGFRTATPLHIDQPAPAATSQSADFAEQEVTLLPAAFAALHELARSRQVPLTTLMESAWAVLLGRYSGQEDIVFGATVSGHTTAFERDETMLGLFINNLPIRARIAPGKSFLAWARDFQARTFAQRRYEHIPLAQIQSWSEIAPGARLFDTILVVNYETFAMEDLSKSLEIGNMRFLGWTAFPLSFYIVLRAQDAVLRIKYDSRRFAEHAILRLLNHFTTLLETITTDPDQRIAELSLLNAAERQMILTGWSPGHLEYSADGCMHHLIEKQAAHAPDSVAVLAQPTALTYRELNQRANRLAHYLRSHGAGPEVPAALYLEHNTPDMAVGLVGIWKAGGAPLPLDPAYPQAYVAALLEDAGAPIVVTQQKLAANLPAEVRVIALDADSTAIEIERERDSNPTVSLAPDNLAWVSCVSLPTGRAGGVAMEHRALRHLAETQQQILEVEPGSRVLMFSPWGLDLALFELVMALGAGATLCLAPQEALLPGPGLARLLRDQAITHITLSAAVLHAMPFTELSTLRTIAVVDGAADVEKLAQWAAEYRCFTLSGTTETTIWSTVAALTGESNNQQKVIGKPVAGTQTCILDRYLQPLPVGVAGERYIGGAGLARGYHRHPALTAEKFLPHPFNDEAGTRLYRTGEVARYTPDGAIELLGRADSQVKIRGVRVEPAEVEAALHLHPAVRQAAVVARTDDGSGAYLAAYIVAAEAEEKVAEDIAHNIRSFLEARLPGAMRPDSVMLLESLPRTADDRLDYEALPTPGRARPSLATSYIAPHTEAEKTIAAIWQQMLRIDKVGVDDNFFDLGGHSLLMIQVHGELQKAFQQDIPIVELFNYATVGTLARHLSQTRQEASFEKSQSRAASRRDSMLQQRQLRRKRQE